MKNLALITLGASLLIQGCAGNSGRPAGNAEIFGKMTIIDDTGKDISKACGLDANGVMLQKAGVGENLIDTIVCMPGSYIYRIKSGGMSVNVPEDNIAVYFGDVTVRLTAAGYDAKVTDGSSNGLYKGSKPLRNSILKISSGEKFWHKNFLGSTGGR